MPGTTARKAAGTWRSLHRCSWVLPHAQPLSSTIKSDFHWQCFVSSPEAFNNSNGTSKHHRTGGTRPSLEQCHEELQNSSLATGLQDGSKGFKLTACCRPPSCWGMLLAAHSLQVQTLEVSWWFSPPLVCRPKKFQAWSLFLCLVRNISGKKHVLTVLKQSAFVKSIVLRTSFQGVGVPVATLFPPSRSKPTPTSSGEA